MEKRTERENDATSGDPGGNGSAPERPDVAGTEALPGEANTPELSNDPGPAEQLNASESASEEMPGNEPATGPSEEVLPVGSIPEARQITRARARDLRALLSKYVLRHRPPSAPKPVVEMEPPRLTGAHAKLLPILRVIPASLVLLFGFSFVWDFTGISFTLFGTTYFLEGLLRIIAVSGLIGFLTNWVAITMLFNPRKARPILGQGLIPAQRERVIYRLAKAVSEDLINEEIIKQKIEENEIIPKYREMALSVTRGVLEDQEFREELKLLTADYVQKVLTSEEVRHRIVEYAIEKIEAYVGEGVGGLALKAYRYLGEEDFKRRIDKAVYSIPTQLDFVLDEMDHLLDLIPEKIEARSEDIEEWATRIVLAFVENLDVYDMIMSNMVQYDESRLEELLKRSTNEQLNYIKYLGGLLGMAGGLVIWQPVPALVLFTAVGGLLFGIDETVYRLRRRPA
jgi:hypothetical protein